MTEYANVTVETVGPVTTIGIDRPSVRNAVDKPTAQALAAAFRDFDADPDASVAILYGHGGTFCAGADLKAVADGSPNRFERDGDAPMGVSRLRLSKPVIAAVAGHAVAGGLELAIWADLRVCDEDAVFGVYCRRWGVPLIDGGTVRLPHIVGAGRAMDLILTGRSIGADEALSIGLVNRVVPRGQSFSAAMELARQIAVFPQTCMRHDRLSMIEGCDLSEDDAMANEYDHGVESITADALAGATRFRDGDGRHGQFDNPPSDENP